MAKYAANPNGDWWEIQDGAVAAWVIDTEDLDAAQLQEMEQELDADKFEQFIYQHGRRLQWATN